RCQRWGGSEIVYRGTVTHGSGLFAVERRRPCGTVWRRRIHHQTHGTDRWPPGRATWKCRSNPPDTDRGRRRFYPRRWWRRWRSVAKTGAGQMIKPRRLDVDRSDGIPLTSVAALLPGQHFAFYLGAGDLVGYGVK